MRVTKKWVAAAAAAALTLTSLPAVPAVSVQAADSVDQTVRLQPWNASTFNDTNGDGLGEFEGWGTSLCWWANRIGYSDALTSQAAELFFSDEGLDMNIGRYNVGGGDATGEVQEVPVNKNAQFYDLTNWGTNPTGAGSSMSVDTYTKMENITYSVSDADFGLTKGEAVGSFQKIGWINKLDDEAGSGDNLRYTVEVDEAGAYTVKLMMTLEGTNTRDVALRVNEGENQTDYVVDADTVNSSIVAEGNSGGSNCMLFVVTIPTASAGVDEKRRAPVFGHCGAYGKTGVIVRTVDQTGRSAATQFFPVPQKISLCKCHLFVSFNRLRPGRIHTPIPYWPCNAPGRGCLHCLQIRRN